MTVPLSPANSSSTVAVSAKSPVEDLQYSSCGKSITSSFEDVPAVTEHSSISATSLSITLPELDYAAESSAFQHPIEDEETNSDAEHDIQSFEMDVENIGKTENYYTTATKASQELSPPTHTSDTYVATISDEEISAEEHQEEKMKENDSSVSNDSKSQLEEWVEQAFTYAHDKPLPDIFPAVEPEITKAEIAKVQTPSSRSSMRGVHALQELMETERDFAKDLRILVKICLEPLEEISWIPNEHKQLLVRNGQAILAFQTEFLKALEEAYQPQQINATETASQSRDLKAIARCFSQLGKGFSVYTDYCIQHDKAMKLYKEYSSRIEFISYLRKCSSEGNEQKGNSRLHFDDYLIKPVQRICRYQLLLKEIKKFTIEGSVEHEELAKGIKTMDEVVGNINTEKGKQDVAARTELFVSRLEDHWKLNKRFVRPLGSFVISGALEMMYLTEGSKVKYLGCAVFNTYMIIIRPKKLTLYEPKYWFPLRLFELTDLEEGQGNLMHAWILHYDKHLFEFSATCPKEKQLWMKAISEAIAHSRAQFEARGSSEINIGNATEELLVSSLEDSIPSTPKLRTSGSFATISESTAHLTDSLLVEVSAALKSPTTSNGHVIPLPQQSSSSRTSFTGTSNNEHNPSRLLNRYSHSALEQVYKRDSKNYQHHSIPANMLYNSNHTNTIYGHRQTNSIDLKDLFQPAGVKEKMSQFKTSHFHAQRMAVDQKLHDVSTDNFLAARAKSVRERDSFDNMKRRSGIHKTVSMMSFSKNNDDMLFDDSGSDGYPANESSHSAVHQTIGGIVINAVKRKSSLPDHRRNRSIYTDPHDENKPKSAGAVDEKPTSFIHRRRSISIKSINNDNRISRLSGSFNFPSFSTSSNQSRRSFSAVDHMIGDLDKEEDSQNSAGTNGFIGKFVRNISNLNLGSAGKGRASEGSIQSLEEDSDSTVGDSTTQSRGHGQTLLTNLSRRNSSRSSLSSPLKQCYRITEDEATNDERQAQIFGFHRRSTESHSLPPAPEVYNYNDQHHTHAQMAAPSVNTAVQQLEKDKRTHTFRKLKEMASPRLKSGALMLLARKNSNLQTVTTASKDADNLPFRKGWLKRTPPVDKSEFMSTAEENVSRSYRSTSVPGHEDKQRNRPVIALNKTTVPEVEGNSETHPYIQDAGYDVAPPTFLKKAGESHDTFVSCKSSVHSNENNTPNQSLGNIDGILSVDTSRDRIHQSRC